MRRSIGLAALLVLGAVPAAAAQSSATKLAAATITTADVRRRILIIADDSMGGRNTPSPGLTKTANYIAGEFKRLGLRPGGDSGTFLLSYPIERRRVLADRSTLRFGSTTGGASATLSFQDGAALVFTTAARQPVVGGVVVIGGIMDRDRVSATAVKDRIAVVVPSWSSNDLPAGLIPLLQRLPELGVLAMVVIVHDDSSFTQFSRAQARGYQAAGVETEQLGRDPMVIFVREAAVSSQIPEAAQQFEQLRSSGTTVVQPMEGWKAEAAVRDSAFAAATAPDVVGIVEGSDPVLKNEYVVFSAHMDHVGKAGEPGSQCAAMGADSICNGADDDGSGTVGVVELAEAFSQPGVKPKRSLIFLTVSGEEKDLWGSDWFVHHPPAPLPQLVADLNADMIGRNWKDTIVAIGKEHSDLGATLDRVNAAHPELHMVAIDDRWPEESFYTRSDHYNFARKGVPILFFFNGVHPDYHRPSDSPDKINAEKESRVLQLLFYVGLDIANAVERPKWVPASYRQIVVP
jgi:peptidase M28-like protein